VYSSGVRLKATVWRAVVVASTWTA
jgi:hypothetical protein